MKCHDGRLAAVAAQKRGDQQVSFRCNLEIQAVVCDSKMVALLRIVWPGTYKRAYVGSTFAQAQHTWPSCASWHLGCDETEQMTGETWTNKTSNSRLRSIIRRKDLPRTECRIVLDLICGFSKILVPGTDAIIYTGSPLKRQRTNSGPCSGHMSSPCCIVNDSPMLVLNLSTLLFVSLQANFFT